MNSRVSKRMVVVTISVIDFLFWSTFHTNWFSYLTFWSGKNARVFYEITNRCSCVQSNLFHC